MGTLQDFQALCDAGQWCDAFDGWRAYPTTWLKHAEHRDAWLAFLCGETRLLHHACAQVVACGKTVPIRHWYADLLPQEAASLYTRFRVVQLSPQHVNAVTDLLKAAGLAVTARAIADVTVPLTAVENLCGWLDGVSLDTSAEAPLGRRLEALSRLRSAADTTDEDRCNPAAVLESLMQAHLQHSSHPLPSIRLARIGERARAWLGVPVQVTGGPVQVPLAYVIGQPGAEVGRADQMLAVDMVTPGTGRAFQHADAMLLLAPPGTHQQAETAEQHQRGGAGETFITSMQHAFTRACDLAGRHGVDARWRLLRGTQPEAAGDGASASGQALRAFYGALTGTVPDPDVILLAQVTADGRLDGVDHVPAKTRAIAAAVQAQRAKTPLAPVQAGACDTIAVATPANEDEAWDALPAGTDMCVVRVRTASDVVPDRLHPEGTSQPLRAQLTTELVHYLTESADRLATLPSYYPARLRDSQVGQRGFDAIHQPVQLIEDRAIWARQQAEARERARGWARCRHAGLRAAPRRPGS